MKKVDKKYYFVFVIIILLAFIISFLDHFLNLNNNVQLNESVSAQRLMATKIEDEKPLIASSKPESNVPVIQKPVQQVPPVHGVDGPARLRLLDRQVL